MKTQKIQRVVAERISTLCEERKLSYYSLSYKSAVPLTTLRHIVDGTTCNPGLLTITKICDGLNITLGEFFDTEEFIELLKE